MRLVTVALASLLLSGVVSCASTPHQGGLYRLGEAKPMECSHPVRLLVAEQAPPVSRELARISATCPYVSPSTCERILLARGCELDADAVVLRESHVIGTKAKPQLSDEALAIGFGRAVPSH